VTLGVASYRELYFVVVLYRVHLLVDVQRVRRCTQLPLQATAVIAVQYVWTVRETPRTKYFS
jgi:hypothetical protein